jgi:hypothetical protein
MENEFRVGRLRGGAIILSAIPATALLTSVANTVSSKGEVGGLLVVGALASVMAYAFNATANHLSRSQHSSPEEGPQCGRCFRPAAVQDLHRLNFVYSVLRALGWSASAQADARFCSRCARILNWSMAVWALLVAGGLAFFWR